jgi:hypothetical protein
MVKGRVEEPPAFTRGLPSTLSIVKILPSRDRLNLIVTKSGSYCL